MFQLYHIVYGFLLLPALVFKFDRAVTRIVRLIPTSSVRLTHHASLVKHHSYETYILQGFADRRTDGRTVCKGGLDIQDPVLVASIPHTHYYVETRVG
jgi:hypothetical protein